MDQVFIAAAIPFFFLLMGIELLVTRGLGRYRFSDSITNLSCGVGQQVVNAAIAGVLLLPYTLVYQHRLFTVAPTSTLGWVAAWAAVLFAVDFCYFLFHWASHRVHFLWALHAVHHQSEEYNLSVALRQSWFGTLFAQVFYLPLALLGVPPALYAAAVAVDTLYQFWIHVRGGPRLGPLEWVLNTPSHHRVHHGQNPRYIDKNYAGILIIFDRLFGTFVPEDEEPVYGVIEPLATWNPLWANVKLWAGLVDLTRRARGLDRLRVWFKPPGWRPAELGGELPIPEIRREDQILYDRPTTRGLRAYVGLHYALLSFAVFFFLLKGPLLPTAQHLATAALLLGGATALGLLLDGHPRGRMVEAARLTLSVGLAGVVLGPSAAGALAGVALASAAALRFAPGLSTEAPTLVRAG